MNKNQNQKQLNKAVFVRALFVISICFCSCNKINKESFLDNLQSKRNVFGISKTDFFYKNSRLYKMNIPEPSLHDSFISYNYFIVKNNKIYEISILNSCYQNYMSGNYVVNDTLSNSLTNCSINFLPVIDFSLRHSDSLKFDNKHWTILNKKIIIKNDTVYKFIRNFGSENYRTVIFATKKEGFVGVYDSIVNQNEVINPIGITFTKFKSIERFATKKIKFDLKILKEFKNVE